MKESSFKMLEDQLEKTINILENEKIKNPKPMLNLILDRYKKAMNIIRAKPVNSLKEEDFKIYGSTRAYLEAYSDYLNPVLNEMYKSEKLIDEIFKN